MVSQRTLMMSSYDVIVTSRAMLWCHRISLYKTPHMACGAAYLTWELRVHFTLVPSSTAGYSCTLGSTRWRVPASGAYFLLLYLIGFIITVSIFPSIDAPKHANTSRECYLEYFARRPHGPTSFWLVPVSTVPAVQVYIFGSVSPPGPHILLRVAYITILASLGGHQSIENGPIRGKYSTLAETQVCKCVVGQGEERYTLSYQESGRLDWGNAYLATRG